MSLRAIQEVLLHIESFRNVDLFNQGLYCLRFTLSYSQHGFTFVASPFDTDSLINIRRSKRMTDPHNIRPLTTDDYTSAFSTRTFLIRYMEEEVKLNDFCVFRVEFDVAPGYIETPMFLKVELMFADLLSSTANELLNSADPFPEYPLKVVATSEVRLNYSLHGVQEYAPVTFNEMFFCCVNLNVVTALTGFQMRMHSLVPEGQEPERRREQVDIASMWYEALFPKIPPDSIMTHDQVEKTFKDYVGFIGAHYRQLRAFISEVYYNCLNEKRREAFDASRPPGPLFPRLSKEEADGNDELVKVLESKLAAMEPFKTAYDVAKRVIEETNEMSGHVCQLMYLLRELIKASPKAIREFLQARHRARVKERWGESIFREFTSSSEFAFSTERMIGELHNTIAVTRRSNKYYRRLTPMPIEQVGIIPKADKHPILFEQVYEKDNSTEDSGKTQEDSAIDGAPQPSGVHLIVLAHGFQGNSFDMRLFKNNLALLYPEALFLCSSINEGCTDGDIHEMGHNLASEVLKFVEESCPLSSIGRISFIGHSLGGLIVRAALPELEPLSSRMHAYITLSTPHLGYLNNSSRLINMGLWFLKKWRKSQCLKQLTMTDKTHPSKCFLFELSQFPGLEWFKYVVFFSSAQDSYAPFDSARIEVSPATAQDFNLGGIYLQMSGNIISRLKCSQIHRLDVNFRISDNSIDTMIGRKAHIQFLENEALMRMVTHNYPQFFS